MLGNQAALQWLSRSLWRSGLGFSCCTLVPQQQAGIPGYWILQRQTSQLLCPCGSQEDSQLTLEVTASVWCLWATFPWVGHHRHSPLFAIPRYSRCSSVFGVASLFWKPGAAEQSFFISSSKTGANWGLGAQGCHCYSHYKPRGMWQLTSQWEY